MTKYTNTGLLTAREFASSCVSKGVSIKPEHILWTVEQKLIEPIIHTKGVDYFSEYQIYLIDLIQDRREQSLNYPTAAGISRSGNKGRWISPEIGWQEYLFLNKESILNETRKWNLVAPIFPEIQKLHNEYLHKALIKKETFESDLGSKIPFNDTWEPTIAGGAADAFKLLKKHPDISEDILRYWMSKLLARAIRHNPALPLSAQLPNLWTLFEKEETKLSSVFTMGNPIRLSNVYLHTLFLLHFLLSCLSGGMEPPLDEIFTRRSKSKRCVVCSDAFIPKVRGGKQQKLCGKTSCDRELRKQREVGRRKLKRTA